MKEKQSCSYTSLKNLFTDGTGIWEDPKRRRRNIRYAVAANGGKCIKNTPRISESNSRRLREAIALVLFDVKGNCSGEKYDTGNFRNEENERLEKALLMAFDPYTNEEIMELLKEQFQVDMLSQGQVKEYYRFR